MPPESRSSMKFGAAAALYRRTTCGRTSAWARPTRWTRWKFHGRAARPKCCAMSPPISSIRSLRVKRSLLASRWFRRSSQTSPPQRRPRTVDFTETVPVQDTYARRKQLKCRKHDFAFVGLLACAPQRACRQDRISWIYSRGVSRLACWIAAPRGQNQTRNHQLIHLPYSNAIAHRRPKDLCPISGRLLIIAILADYGQVPRLKSQRLSVSNSTSGQQI